MLAINKQDLSEQFRKLIEAINQSKAKAPMSQILGPYLGPVIGTSLLCILGAICYYNISKPAQTKDIYSTLTTIMGAKLKQEEIISVDSYIIAKNNPNQSLFTGMITDISSAVNETKDESTSVINITFQRCGKKTNIQIPCQEKLQSALQFGTLKRGVLYGPSGTGKTYAAQVMASKSKKNIIMKIPASELLGHEQGFSARSKSELSSLITYINGKGYGVILCIDELDKISDTKPKINDTLLTFIDDKFPVNGSQNSLIFTANEKPWLTQAINDAKTPQSDQLLLILSRIGTQNCHKFQALTKEKAKEHLTVSLDCNTDYMKLNNETKALIQSKVARKIEQHTTQKFNLRDIDNIIVSVMELYQQRITYVGFIDKILGDVPKLQSVKSNKKKYGKDVASVISQETLNLQEELKQLKEKAQPANNHNYLDNDFNLYDNQNTVTIRLQEALKKILQQRLSENSSNTQYAIQNFFESCNVSFSYDKISCQGIIKCMDEALASLDKQYIQTYCEQNSRSNTPKKVQEVVQQIKQKIDNKIKPTVFSNGALFKPKDLNKLADDRLLPPSTRCSGTSADIHNNLVNMPKA